MNLIVLTAHEEQVIEINTRSMDMGGAAVGGGTDGVRISRGHLVEVVEERAVTVDGLVVEGGDERAIDELGIVALPHIGAVHVVVDAIFAAGDQAHLIRQSDHSSRPEVLVFMTGIAARVDKRSEPVTHRKRTRIAGVPGEPDRALSQLVEGELGTIGTIAGNDVDVSVFVHSRRRIGHPYARSASRPALLLGLVHHTLAGAFRCAA